MEITEPQPSLALDSGTKPLGVVWVHCLHPVVALGLMEILRTKAEVLSIAEEPDLKESPSSIVLCADTPQNLTRDIKWLGGLAPKAPILVFGLLLDLSLARCALQAGAKGFIHGGMQPSQITAAHSLVSQGEVIFPLELLKELTGEGYSQELSFLTSRQREILELVAQGLTNAEIAKQLFLSQFTIKQHLRAAYKLLGVKNRTEAARIVSRGSSI